MIKATANTNVGAVRQHGGGLVNTQQPRAHARGRQLTLRGGVINRRCEATSIIPLPFPSSAAAVYPLTGVRRARKLSPSLRSNNRPHAQLVVGYKPLPSSNLLNAMLDQIDRNTGVPIHDAPLVMIQQAAMILYESQDHRHVLGRRELIKVKVGQRLDLSLSLSDGSYVRRPLRTVSGRVTENGRHKIQSEHQALDDLDGDCLPVFANPRVPARDPDRIEEGSDRTKRLNPICQNPLTPRPTDRPNEDQEKKHSQNRQHPGSAENASQREPNVYFLIQHGPLLISESTVSLQAPSHYVQRGAA